MFVQWKRTSLREVFLLLLNMKGQRVISTLAADSLAPAKKTIESSSRQRYVTYSLTNYYFPNSS